MEGPLILAEQRASLQPHQRAPKTRASPHANLSTRHVGKKSLFDSGKPITCSRMESFLVPHTSTTTQHAAGSQNALTTNSGLYKYHDFVRMRQQLPLEETSGVRNAPDLSQEALNWHKASHGPANFSIQAGSSSLENAEVGQQLELACRSEPSSQPQHHQRVLTKQFSAHKASAKQGMFGKRAHQPHAQAHQHSNSVKSPKVGHGSVSHAPQDLTNQSLEIHGSEVGQKALNTSQLGQANSAGKAEGLKLVSRSHLTSAHYAIQKANSFKGAHGSAPRESIQLKDFSSWHESHAKASIPRASTNQDQLLFGGQPQAESQSDHKLVQRPHQARMVKLNQSAFKDPTGFSKANSPHVQSKGVRLVQENQLAQQDLMGSAKLQKGAKQGLVQSLGLQQQAQPQLHHQVYQTINKMGDNSHYGAGQGAPSALNKIKTHQLSQKGAPHHMVGQFAKEGAAGERVGSNGSVLKSEAAYASAKQQVRDMSNYSTVSQYTQLTNMVSQLKTNTSGLMQQSPAGPIPIFIQRNPQRHTGNTVAVMSTSSAAPESFAAQQASNKTGQSCMLPQILAQKEEAARPGAYGSVVPGSVLENNRPAPLQMSQKRKNAEQASREYPDYYLGSGDSAGVPKIDTAKGGPSHLHLSSQSGKLVVAVSSSASFKESGVYQELQANSMSRKQATQVSSSQSHSWQTASTSRKQKQVKAASEQPKFLTHQKPSNHAGGLLSEATPLDVSKVAAAKGGIYSVAIKSATATVAPSKAARTETNSLSFAPNDESLKLNHTGELGRGKATLDGLAASAHLQGSQTALRKQHKEMRSISAKWHPGAKPGPGAASIGKSSPIQLQQQSLEAAPSKVIEQDPSAFMTPKKQKGGKQEAGRPAPTRSSERRLHQEDAGFAEAAEVQLGREAPLHVGFQFSYDLGDEPDEDDDEINNTDGEEGEEEPDDILIVEGEDEEIEDEEEIVSPNLRNKSAKAFRGGPNCTSAVKGICGSKGLTPANKSLNMSQEGANTQLYGGDIYLLGGSHFLMKGGPDDTHSTPFAKMESQASTNACSEVPARVSANRQLSQLRKRGTGKRKRALNKGSKQLRKIQERNSIQEDEELEQSVHDAAQQDTASGSASMCVSQHPSNKKLATPLLSGMSLGAAAPSTGLSEKQRKLAVRQEYLGRPPNQIVTMIRSPFAGREPFIFFPYPPFVGFQRPLPGDMHQIVQFSQEQLKPYCMPGFKVSDSTHTYNCVVNALKMAGFRHVTGSAWNVIWTGLFKQGRLRSINAQQHINHFAGSWAIGRKDYMWRNVQRMRRLHGKAFDIAPPTYIFPDDYKRWLNDRELSAFKHMYIMKPNAASCGKGIRVIGKKQQVAKRSGYIVSKYVSKPHLIRGFKYDLRLYVLVTSFDPLKIYLFRDGLVRLATVPYSTSKASLKQRFVHLTNYSVNKKAEAYVKNNGSSPQKPPADTEEEPETAEGRESKLSLEQLRKEYERMGVDYEAVFAQIKDVIVKTVLAAEQPILQSVGGSKNKNACFEIYGFDVIVDAKLRPWLLEVNVSPSLSSSSLLDKQIKTLLLSDSLYLVGFRLIDRKQQEVEKAKQNKQRLLGFESQKSNKVDLSKVESQVAQQTQGAPQNQAALSKDPGKYIGSKSRTAAGASSAQTAKPAGVFGSFVSNESQPAEASEQVVSNGAAAARDRAGGLGASAGKSKSGVASERQFYSQPAGRPNCQERAGRGVAEWSSSLMALCAGTGSLTHAAHKSASPNRRRAALAKIQPPKPWLKDLGEPLLQRSNTNGGLGSAAAISAMPMEGYINLQESDLEMLADFEEEQMRRGHFELLFPTARSVDSYRPFMSQNRRTNLVLWAYVKQGAPLAQLAQQFRFAHAQSQLAQPGPQQSSLVALHPAYST